MLFFISCKDPNLKLHEGIVNSNQEEIIKALNEGANINSFIENAPQIFYADNLEILELLENQVANLSITDSLGKNLLMNASGKGYYDIVKYLLDNNLFNVFLKDNNGQTAADYAYQNNHKDIFALFLEKELIGAWLVDNDNILIFLNDGVMYWLKYEFHIILNLFSIVDWNPYEGHRYNILNNVIEGAFEKIGAIKYHVSKIDENSLVLEEGKIFKRISKDELEKMMKRNKVLGDAPLFFKVLIPAIQEVYFDIEKANEEMYK